MMNIEFEMVAILKELKEKYYVSGLKAEFEAEGSRLAELWHLKELVAKSDLNLTIKIGGAEAIRDFYDARELRASCIVAPMIETPFAMKKYLSAIKKVYAETEKRNITAFYANIETIDAYQNIDRILEVEGVNSLRGIVLGRSDMSYSLGMTKNDVNSSKMLAIAKDLAVKVFEAGFEFVVGGNISTDSLTFLEELPANMLTAFETRKVIFRCPMPLKHKAAKEGINKAIEFELIWLRYKKEYYSQISTEDDERIKSLENRMLCS